LKVIISRFTSFFDGFDIFIASSELDRDVGEFAALIAQCQQARQSIETQATVHVQD